MCTPGGSAFLRPNHSVQVMVSSCGHDGPMGAAGVKRLARLGMIERAPGMGALDMNTGRWRALTREGAFVLEW